MYTWLDVSAAIATLIPKLVFLCWGVGIGYYWAYRRYRDRLKELHELRERLGLD